MNLQTERSLIKRARQGDHAAFEELYHAYKDRLYIRCLQLTKRHDMAEDFVQQTFLKAYKNIKQFKGGARLYTWLFRIATNEVFMGTRRGKSRLREHADIDALPERHHPSIKTNPLANVELHETMLSLPRNVRPYVVLNEAYGFTWTEVAHLTNLPLSTWKARLHNARLRLEAM